MFLLSSLVNDDNFSKKLLSLLKTVQTSTVSIQDSLIPKLKYFTDFNKFSF